MDTTWSSAHEPQISSNRRSSSCLLSEKVREAANSSIKRLFASFPKLANLSLKISSDDHVVSI